jgi:hypothetical protein
MSLHEPTGWIVCYDIRQPKRLIRVHRHLKKWGVPLQYSVFLVQASAARLHRRGGGARCAEGSRSSGCAGAGGVVCR